MRESGKIEAMFVPGVVLGLWGLSALGCAGGRGAEPASARPPATPVAQAPASPAEPASEELVTFTLIADRAAVLPGQPFTLAARFDIEPGWHIYWQNPGESGLPTEVTFEAPAGFEVGAVRYPGPVAFSSPGPVVSYGYGERVLLSAPVEVTGSLPAGDSVTFTADAFWLACRDTCVRGQGETTLTLPVLAPGSEPPGPEVESERVLSEHLARLPRPWPAAARHAWEPSPAGPVLVVRVPVQLVRGAPLVFFPSVDDQLAVTGQEQVAGAADTVLRVQYRADPGPVRARGVLGAGDIFYRLDVSGPAAGN